MPGDLSRSVQAIRHPDGPDRAGYEVHMYRIKGFRLQLHDFQPFCGPLAQIDPLYGRPRTIFPYKKIRMWTPSADALLQDLSSEP